MENLSYLRFHYAILPDLRISPLILYKVELRCPQLFHGTPSRNFAAVTAKPARIDHVLEWENLMTDLSQLTLPISPSSVML